LLDYQEGYLEWRDSFDKGKAGIFTTNVAAVVSGNGGGTEPMMQDILFYVFAALTLICGALIILNRNPVK